MPSPEKTKKLHEDPKQAVRRERRWNRVRIEMVKREICSGHYDTVPLEIVTHNKSFERDLQR